MSINHALCVQSDFSIGQSLLQVDHLVDRAKELGYQSVAITDLMTISAMPDFFAKAKKAGIKPIIGVKLRIVDDPRYRKPTKKSGEVEKPNPMVTLKAYILNEVGLKWIMRLLSRANTAEYFYYVSRLGLDDLLEAEGLAITTGDFNGLANHPHALHIFDRLSARFPTFAELVPIDTPLFDTLNAKMITVARRAFAKTIVGYPALYRDPSDASSLDVLEVITGIMKDKMNTPRRSRQFVKTFDMRPPEALNDRVGAAVKRSFKWHGSRDVAAWSDGLAGIQALSDLCTYTFEKMPISLPIMAEDEFATLVEHCKTGWRTRFATYVLGHIPAPADLPAYKERLTFELGVLKKMGFAGYFLLVEDVVAWSKNNGIIVGPGRGSVGGSLVAYLIGITDVDPMRFNLLFERFINPDRLDLPDADLDFMSSKRHLVVEYLRDKYGHDRVAGISNYSTLASASAVRDTGRVFGLQGIELTATKLVPKEHGQSFTLTEAREAVPEIEKFGEAHPDIWGHALKLEGAMRSFGQHAAGVVVGGEPLINRAVLETRSGDMPVCNWDKRTVEDFGLVKMDLLGLSTLDTLEIAKHYIKERHGIDVDYLRLELDDPDIMDAFGRGDTTGVFQFESGGMKRLLRDIASLGRLTFEDIAAATALYRPGPMDAGLMADYVAIKKGLREVELDHPAMANALKDTSGIIIYQEQVMQLSVDLAGFTRTEADHLRKAMGKKDKDKMAEQRDKWVNGCIAHVGMDTRLAGDLFDKIEKFAGYGFNKSHAIEYSVISFWTMWVRVRYPAEYFAACMSIVKDDKLPSLVGDARSIGIEVLPPDINLSTDKYVIPDDKHILAPFSSVMGCSENTALAIMRLRAKHTGFDSLEKFRLAAATPGSKVNTKVVTNLEKVGAFAKVELTTPAARSLERRKDQMELMPGLIIDALKADRTTDVTEKFLRAKVIHLVQEYRSCTGCDLQGEPHPAVRMKSTVKYMVVADCPSWQEEKKDKLLEGDGAAYVITAINEAKLSVSEGYFTTLVKAKKNDKFLSNGQINGCSGFLAREIDLIKPPVIVALGSAAIRYLLPGVKGSSAELAGKAIYDPIRDATIVCGINPQQIGFDASKTEVLQAVFDKVAEIVL